MFGPFFPEPQVSRRGKTHVSYAYIFSYIKRVSFKPVNHMKYFPEIYTVHISMSFHISREIL